MMAITTSSSIRVNPRLPRLNFVRLMVSSLAAQVITDRLGDGYGVVSGVEGHVPPSGDQQGSKLILTGGLCLLKHEPDRLSPGIDQCRHLARPAIDGEQSDVRL